MIRTGVSAMAGIVIAVVIVMVVEAIGHYVYPPPPGIDVSKADELARLIDSLPIGALLFVVLAWVMGAAGGAVVGSWLAPTRTLFPALAVGLFVTAAVSFTFSTIHHPAWMIVAGLGLPLPSAWIAARLAR